MNIWHTTTSEGNAYLAILGSGNITIEKLPGFQSRHSKFLTLVISIIIVVVEESIDNGKRSGSKSAAPFTNTLINLDKGVISRILVLLEREGKHLREQKQRLGL